jgi:hypothetical protein
MIDSKSLRNRLTIPVLCSLKNLCEFVMLLRAGDTDVAQVGWSLLLSKMLYFGKFAHHPQHGCLVT